MSQDRIVSRTLALPKRRPAVAATNSRSAAAAAPQSAARALQQRLGNQDAQVLLARAIATREMRETTLTSLIPKLQLATSVLSSPHDSAELEAEATARQVMRMAVPEPKVDILTNGTSLPQVQRVSSQSVLTDRATATNFSSSHLNGGTPLSPAVRTFMEPRFGVDFNDIRIHTGETAEHLSRDLNAHAFTTGGHIFFGKNKYQPDSQSGKELIAHELTHTIQQGAAKTFATNQGTKFGQNQPGPQLSSVSKVAQLQYNIIQRSWIGDRIDWVRTATHDGNWAGADPPGAYYVLNGLSMDDMVRVLRALKPADRKKLADNLDEQGGGFDRSRLQLALSNAAAGPVDKAFRASSESLHWAVRSGNFSIPPDGAFYLLAAAKGAERARLIEALNRDTLDALIYHRDEADEVPGGAEIMREINRKRGQVGLTSREKRLLDLIDSKEWDKFFVEFNGMNETDQLRFLAGNLGFGVIAQISSHIKSAEWGGYRDRLRYLLQRALTPASTNLYVDAVTQYSWKPKYRVANEHEYSKYIRFSSVAFDFELDITTIDDAEMSEDAADKNIQEAQPGPGGFLWPKVRNRSTLPNLWKVKQDVRRQYDVILFEDVLKQAISVIQYFLNVVFSAGQGMIALTSAALRRASLYTYWMKGSQVIKGRLPPSADALRARELANQLAKDGHPVIANLGGAGARHEPAHAININNQATARKNIPNLVKADGSDIGTLFEPATLDRIEGYNMAEGMIDWSRAAPGAYKTLKPGGELSYRYRGVHAEAQFAADQLRNAKFKDVQVIEKVWVKAKKL